MYFLDLVAPPAYKQLRGLLASQDIIDAPPKKTPTYKQLMGLLASQNIVDGPPPKHMSVILTPPRMWFACTRGKSCAPSFIGVPEASRPVSAGLSGTGTLGRRS